MAKNKPNKIVSKKHLARQEREQRQTRIITGVAIGVVAVVALLIAYGLLSNTVLLYWRPAVTVNGESLSLHEFQVRVQATRQSLIGQYMQYIQFAQMFGMDPTSDPQMAQTLQQISGELDAPPVVGGQVMDSMINDLVIRQYAKKNGITVSAADVEAAVQSALNYFPNGTPTPTLTPTLLVYPTLDATQQLLVTPTLAPTLAPTLGATLTPRPTRTPDLTSTATAVPSITPTATPYTLSGYQSQYKNILKQYSTDGMSEAEFRNIYYETSLYEERVKAKVTADITHEQEQVWARHILVADEATAQVVQAGLLAGTDFTVLASEFSLDTSTKDKGGDMGWLSKGAMTPELEAAAFSMKIGETSQPIKDTFGYHIVQVLGHEVRPLSDTDYQTAVTNAFNKWLQEQRTNSKIVINSGWTSVTPTSPTLAEAQAADAATATAYVGTYQAQHGTK